MLKDTSQRTALLLAATNNHLSVVKQLVDAKQNGTQTDYNGNGIYEVLYEYSDNNSNGLYDAGDDIIQDYDGNDTISIAYEFVDRGNGMWDPHEPYYDIDSSGTYDLNEPYQDRNCNNKFVTDNE